MDVNDHYALSSVCRIFRYGRAHSPWQVDVGVCEPPTCAVFLASGHGTIDARETRGMETSEYLGISCIHTTIVPVLPRDLLRAGARW